MIQVTADDILGAIADFLIVGFNSIAIGLGRGVLCLLYFWFIGNKLDSAMEVASFLLWAGIPYYICDKYNLSGIVKIITVGLLWAFMWQHQRGVIQLTCLWRKVTISCMLILVTTMLILVTVCLVQLIFFVVDRPVLQENHCILSSH